MADSRQAGVADRITGGLSRLQTHVAAMPAQRRSRWAAGAVMVAALVAGMWWYASRPDWRVLFSGLDGKDVQVVSQELAAAGIAFEVTGDGTGVQVPADALEKARMEVAAKGMPQTGRLGFELFDRPNWVGSEFDERVNYQRALEGELEHTIESLDVVRAARVHLVLPQASLYSSEQKVAKASVVLKLKRASLPVEQADSIRSLVAGAVENLAMDQVTLVDANGRANLQAKGGTAAEANAEQALEAKLIAMLEPLAGSGNVRATVNVAYEQGTEERTDEVYDPTQSAPLTVRKSEQTTNGGARASGVPGTASNTPAAAPAGAVQGSAAAAAPGVPPLLQKAALPVYPQGMGPSQNAKEENGTYAVSRHIVHEELGGGRVRRLTAAVVVNDRQTMEGAGKLAHAIWKPRSPEEMRRLEDLAQAAVGYEIKRGDQVVIQNVAFDSNTPEAAPGMMEKVVENAKGLAQPNLLRTGVLGLIGLLVVMLVLKPLARQMVVTMQEPLLLGSGPAPEGSAIDDAEASRAGEDRVELGAGATMGLSGGRRAADLQQTGAGRNGAPELAGEDQIRVRPRLKSRDAIFDHVSEHIRREPAQSTRLLETWIASGDNTPSLEAL